MNEPAAPRSCSLAGLTTQVPREALCARVCSATSVRLVVVRAAAGFGKTATMTQMRDRLEAEGTATAWLTLDRADNDAPRFMRCLDEAVANIAGEAVHPAAPTELMQRLAAHDARFVLFVDDFECIQEPTVLGLMRELIERLPRGGRVVIGARSQPDLGLGRLRARGQLLELDTDDLRFSIDDTERFFRLRPRLQITTQAVHQLHRKTEGWVAAIALAAVALQGQPPDSDFIKRFSGSNRAVAAYLAEAVLAQQPEATRQFLLRTSVLRRLEPALCDALVGCPDSQLTLEQLEAGNLFISTWPSASGEARSWRYHSLFADFLRAQLASEQPERATRLHLAASGWYEAHGRPVPAIEHAIEGGDLPHAAALLAQHAEGFVEQGRMRLLGRWLAALPPAQVDRRPLLQVTGVWADCFTRGPIEAMNRLQRSGCEHSPDPAVQAHVAALKPLLFAMMDRYEEASAAGHIGLAAIPSCRPFADIVLRNTMAHVQSVMGEPAESHRLLDMARGGAVGSAFTRPFTEAMEGMLDLHEGRLRQAAARFRLAAGHTDGDAYNHAHGNAWAGVLYAGVVYEADQLDQAQHLLNVYQPMVRDVALPDHMIMSHVLSSRIAFQRGDVDAAQQVLSELEYLGHHRRLPRVVAAAGLERARLLLMQGHALASRDALARADTPGLWERVRAQRLPSHDLDDLMVSRLRWDVAFGDACAALPLLDAEIDAATASARHRRGLKLRVLKALAQYRSADIAGAMHTMDSALRQACHDGFVRLVLDEGVALAPLLQRLQSASHQQGSDPILNDFVQRLLRSLGAGPAESGHGAAPTDPADQGSLTRQEVRVLQLLAEGYSNGAMAEKLRVADTTVRTHLRSINLKLNAHSRMQAVSAARRLAVIR